MPILDTSDPEILSLRGIHLWHAGLSSCSQRVRITLAELGLEYTSHLIDLEAGENTTEWYQAIHPGGVVPALVHDGCRVIESVDIIDYLDEQLGSRKLTPSSDNADNEMQELMQLADQAQIHLKTLTYEFIFSARPAISAERAAAYQEKQQNEYLKAFHRDFHAGFERQRIAKSVTATDRDFRYLEQKLSDGRSFLVGSSLSLADIAWTPNFHRLDIIGWPYERYPRLREWFQRVSARPSYESALRKWEPQQLLQMLAPKLSARQAAGDGVEAYMDTRNKFGSDHRVVPE